MPQNPVQREHFRQAINETEEARAEVRLHLRMLEQLVEDNLRNLPPFQFNNDADVRIRFVADVGDAGNRLVHDEVIHPFQQLVFLHLIRNFSDDDLLLLHISGAGCDALYHRFCTDSDAPSTRGIHIFDAALADDTPCCREVGPSDIFHECFGIRIRVFQFAQQRVNEFTEVMRRNACQITDTYPRRAVDEQIRQQAGQHGGFFQRIFVVRLEVNYLLLDVGKHLAGNFRQSAFGVAHCPGRIIVNTTEVSLSINERIARIEILCHTDEGVVNGAVAVGMEIFHHFADDSGTFIVGPVCGEVDLSHRVDDAACARFESIADIGYRAIRVDTHRVG